MFIVVKNGSTQKTSGRFQNSQFKNESCRLGELRFDSQEYEANQVRFTKSNSSRQNPTWTNHFSRDTSTGKILQRLEALEQECREYFIDDQAHLQARLWKSQQSLQKFNEKLDALKRDIYKLASEQETIISTNIEPTN
jgi:hypothetical protein